MQIYSVNGAEIPEKTSKPVTIVRTDEEAKERRDALAAKGLTEGVDYYLVGGWQPSPPPCRRRRHGATVSCAILTILLS